MAETKKPKETKKPTTRAAGDTPAVPVVHSTGTFKERYAAGKALRETCPREAHAAWKAPSNRPGAVQLVLEAEKGRIPDLLPLRHGRMVRSAFTFYRGAALTMATDLASTPSTGVRVQCCGDAQALALSHARSGNSAMLSGYMGKSDAFDKATAAFSMAYADQNESDHAALDRAVRKGKVKAVFEGDRWGCS
jgi:hypothetical protein